METPSIAEYTFSEDSAIFKDGRLLPLFDLNKVAVCNNSTKVVVIFDKHELVEANTQDNLADFIATGFADTSREKHRQAIEVYI